MAAAVARAPHHKLVIPYTLICRRHNVTLDAGVSKERHTLFLSSFNPGFPSVWSVVLRVSMGVKMVLNAAAQSETKIVLIGDQSFFMNGFESRRASIPAFAAVSPKRATGP